MKINLNNHALQNDLKIIAKTIDNLIVPGKIHNSPTIKVNDTDYIYTNEIDRDEDLQLLGTLMLINDIYKGIDNDLYR